MKLRQAHLPPPMRLLVLIFSCLLLLADGSSFTVAKKSDPTITKIKLDHQPGGLFYFEDSEVILLYNRRHGNILRSPNAGESWNTIDDLPEGASMIWLHPVDPQTAYVLTMGYTHYLTHDRGETWQSFETAASPSPWREVLTFHGKDAKSVIYHGEVCQSFFECDEVALYTTDGFATPAKLLKLGSRGCNFAQSTEEFTSGDKTIDQQRVFCVARGRYSPWPKDNRIIVSDDYFDDGGTEPELNGGQPVQGIVSMAAVKKFLVAAAKGAGTDEMALYVSDDSKIWHQAEFGDHKVEEEAYTILESTNYSIQVDVMTTRPASAMGVLFTSNSNGTYFTRNIDHTNRNRQGLVDFEKIQGIQGITLVNTVDNWEEVEKTDSSKKKVVTEMSFDDGRSFQALKTKSKDRLHLHSVTNLHNMGRVFSSPAPGIIMGVGNTGDYLKNYKDGDLWVSDDAGVTWWKGQDEAHKYAFGDQGSILVAVYDEEATSKIVYSLDHGHEWKTADLGEKVRAGVLSTARDATSIKFLLIGSKGDDKDEEFYSFAINFEGLHERKCKDSDMEKWYARVDDEGKPSCLMGHKQYYRRRKADADCLIDEEFKDPQPEFEECECADADFECDYNFKKDGDKCVEAGSMVVPEGACENPDDSFRGSPGYRLIPGNDCKRKKGEQKDAEIERPCKGSVQAPADGKINHEISNIDAKHFLEVYYLERTPTSKGDDETIVLRTSDREVFITHDHGKNWVSMKDQFDDEEIIGIYPHEYNNDMVFFLTASKTVYYTANRGFKVHKFQAPQDPNEQDLRILKFHPTKKNWLIWTGARDCGGSKTDCHSVASISTDRGDSWKTLLRYVGKCQFVWDESRGRSKTPEDKERREKLIYCEQHAGENLDNPKQLVASEDFFGESEILFEDIVSYATMSEFIVVASNDNEKQSLKASTSVDGKIFADAHFPPDFQVPRQQAYTVLDSATHAIFMHVTVSSFQNAEHGTLLKSNSNGTSYVTSINGVNRNRLGYVDFEKMLGLEGVALVNIVDNLDEAKKVGNKKLKTKITHNDGAEWNPLEPPKKDVDGNSWSCSGSLETCSLHLHAYTERADPRDTYSSASAVGMLIGAGNVGDALGDPDTADTFLSRDGGITWDNIKKGSYMWEYGDQGSIIVIVNALEPTDTVFYSLDEGRTWTEKKFADDKFRIERITTVPSDNSRNFLLWGLDTNVKKGISTINLDFSGLTDKKCQLDESHPEDGDYTLWQPKHPMQQDNCLFGHVSEYHRKKPDVLCYNAGLPVDHLHSIAKNCSCTRQDFECDFNYARLNDGSCGLIPGYAPADHSAICAEEDVTTWYSPTGYRRIPLSTCSGGHELEYLESKAHPCPGRESEFEEIHNRRISGLGIFFAVVIPLVAASGVGYWVWRNWDGKFGRIRLGDHGGSVFDAGSPWIKYPVMAVAVVVAVAVAIPDVVGRLWRFAKAKSGLGSGPGRYTTRSSFSRGRGEYAVVDEDEGELLGEDSDEEV